MSLIRGVLAAGQFRTQRELNGMTAGDHRNTLIVELANRSSRPILHYQSLDDATLAGTGAVLVFLRGASIRSDAELKAMSDDDLRNTLIVELDAQTHLGVPHLQALDNLALLHLALGGDGGYIRGALAAGGFRTQHELDAMSHDDQRNTLIVELANRTNRSIAHYQALSDGDLGAAGSALVLLRLGRIRSDADLQAMSDDDVRNTLIVELADQTHLPAVRLQGFTTIDLVSEALFNPDRLPLAPILLEPAAGSIQSGRPTLSWRDPGSGNANAAEEFLVEVTRSDNPTFDRFFVNQATRATSLSITNELPAGTSCLWRVRGSNGPQGFQLVGPPAQRAFTVAARPVSPVPPLPPAQPSLQVEVTFDPFSSSSATARFFGGGFLPPEVVDIINDGVVVNSGTANNLGLYSISAGVVAAVPPINHQAVARGQTSGKMSTIHSYSA